MIGIGFIGSGNIARAHAKCLLRIPEVRIVGNVDIAPEAAESFRAEYNSGYCAVQPRRLLRDAAVDAVYVCVPTHLHKDVAVRVARAGKHVFLEKPMALSLREADAVIRAVDKAGVRLMMGFVRRFDNCWLKGREVILSGALGPRPLVWRSSMIGSGPSTPWFNDERYGKGPLLDKCVHNYDFALTVFGRPVEAWGSVMNWRTDVKGPDTGTAVIRFEDGSECLYSVSWGTAARTRYGFEEVVGPLGNLIFNPPAEEIPADLKAEGRSAVLITGASGPHFEPYRKNEMMMDQARHFIEVVKGAAEPPADAIEGRRSLAMACAIFSSARTRRVVRIP